MTSTRPKSCNAGCRCRNSITGAKRLDPWCSTFNCPTEMKHQKYTPLSISKGETKLKSLSGFSNANKRQTLAVSRHVHRVQNPDYGKHFAAIRLKYSKLSVASRRYMTNTLNKVDGIIVRGEFKRKYTAFSLLKKNLGIDGNFMPQSKHKTKEKKLINSFLEDWGKTNNLMRCEQKRSYSLPMESTLEEEESKDEETMNSYLSIVPEKDNDVMLCKSWESKNKIQGLKKSVETKPVKCESADERFVLQKVFLNWHILTAKTKIAGLSKVFHTWQLNTEMKMMHRYQKSKHECKNRQLHIKQRLKGILIEKTQSYEIRTMARAIRKWKQSLHDEDTEKQRITLESLQQQIKTRAIKRILNNRCNQAFLSWRNFVAYQKLIESNNKDILRAIGILKRQQHKYFLRRTFSLLRSNTVAKLQKQIKHLTALESVWQGNNIKIASEWHRKRRCRFALEHLKNLSYRRKKVLAFCNLIMSNSARDTFRRWSDWTIKSKKTRRWVSWMVQKLKYSYVQTPFQHWRIWSLQSRYFSVKQRAESLESMKQKYITQVVGRMKNVLKTKTFNQWKESIRIERLCKRMTMRWKNGQLLSIMNTWKIYASNRRESINTMCQIRIDIARGRKSRIFAAWQKVSGEKVRIANTVKLWVRQHEQLSRRSIFQRWQEFARKEKRLRIILRRSILRQQEVSYAFGFNRILQAGIFKLQSERKILNNTVENLETKLHSLKNMNAKNACDLQGLKTIFKIRTCLQGWKNYVSYKKQTLNARCKYTSKILRKSFRSWKKISVKYGLLRRKASALTQRRKLKCEETILRNWKIAVLHSRHKSIGCKGGLLLLSKILENRQKHGFRHWAHVTRSLKHRECKISGFFNLICKRTILNSFTKWKTVNRNKALQETKVLENRLDYFEITFKTLKIQADNEVRNLQSQLRKTKKKLQTVEALHAKQEEKLDRILCRSYRKSKREQKAEAEWYKRRSSTAGEPLPIKKQAKSKKADTKQLSLYDQVLNNLEDSQR